MGERNYDTTNLPINENLDRFAPQYTPEIFTDNEQRYLKPFFTNLDRPVFIAYNLPEEVNAALDSRYSRSTLSKRRLFLKEYVDPIANPESQPDWENLSDIERNEAIQLKEKFEEYIDYLNRTGGINDILNIQRARGFFGKWLAGYGDDSIAEMGGGFHVSCEGISSVLVEEIVSKRVGISPLVKSTRYVRFSERQVDGNYQYHVPGEIVGTDLEEEFKESMNALFDTYTVLEELYFEYIKEILPKGDDESENSFNRSRAAKRYDDIRDLLPFATKNNMGLSGNGRAYEDLVNRLLANNLGEARWLGKAICEEIKKVAPSFIERPQTERGAEIQLYRRNINTLRDEMADEITGSKNETVTHPVGGWAKLVSSTMDADIEILSTYLSPSSKRKSLEEWRDVVSKMTVEERSSQLMKILDERKLGRDESKRESDRFKKVPRAFERAMYSFDLWGRGGDVRDLRRHRSLIEGHEPFTVVWGFDLEKEVKESPFIDAIRSVLMKSAETYFKIEERFGSEVAQYSVPFAFIQHWFMSMSARELYWIAELRTGPQARSHYKQIVLDMLDEATKKDPSVFQGVMADRNDYRIARRESEKKMDKLK